MLLEVSCTTNLSCAVVSSSCTDDSDNVTLVDADFCKLLVIASNRTVVSKTVYVYRTCSVYEVEVTVCSVLEVLYDTCELIESCTLCSCEELLNCHSLDSAKLLNICHCDIILTIDVCLECNSSLTSTTLVRCCSKFNASYTIDVCRLACCKPSCIFWNLNRELASLYSKENSSNTTLKRKRSRDHLLKLDERLLDLDYSYVLKLW